MRQAPHDERPVLAGDLKHWQRPDRQFCIPQISVDFVLGTAGTNVQGKVREVLRAVEDNLLGESMSGMHALVSREFFDKLISHPKTAEAYKFYAATGAQPLRQGNPPCFSGARP